MKPITWIRLFLFCVVVGSFRVVEARDVRSMLQEKTDTLINPPLMKQGEQILRFDKAVLHIGTMTEDDAPKIYHFTYTNVSDKTINLTRVRTTCGCTVADVHTGEILPGESGVIALTYNPKNHPGTIDTNVFVYLSLSDKMPVARLTLTGNVLPGADEWRRYPYVMGKLRLKQNRIEFREIAFGKYASERVLCGNSGDQSLHLTALGLPAFAAFRTEPEVISPGSEADIVVTIDTSLIPAEKVGSFTFPIIIEGVDGQQTDRTLNIKVNYIK